MNFPLAVLPVVRLSASSRRFAQTSAAFRSRSARLAKLASACLLALCAGVPAHASSVAISSPIMQEVILPMQHPYHGTVDASGNLYIPDFQTGQVYELYAVNGIIPPSPVTRTIGAAFGNANASGVALDSLGNLYITNAISNTISEFVAVGGVVPNNPTVKTILTATAFDNFNGIAVDSLGDLYIANNYNSLLEIKATSIGVFPANPTPINIGASLNNPSDVAVDANGNVFACDYFGNAIVEIYPTSIGVFPTTPTTRTLISGLNAPLGVAVDSSGNVYFNNSNGNNVQKLLAVGGSIPTSNPTVVTLASNPDSTSNPSGILQPIGVMLGPNGIIYVSNYYGGHMNELQTSGINIGGVPVGTTVNMAIQVNIAATVTVGSIQYLTQGGSNLDYKLLTPDTKTTLCTAKTYTSATTCVVDVAFTPVSPGVRLGAVQILDNTTPTPNVLATVPLSGIGMGPQVSYGTPTVVSIGSHPPLGQVNGVAVDGSLDVFAIDWATRVVNEFVLTAGVYPALPTQTFGTGADALACGAVDGAGDLFIGDASSNDILEYKSVGGVLQTGTFTSLGIGTTSFPSQLAFDANQNLYDADYGAHKVFEATAASNYSSFSPITTTSIVSPWAIAIDAAGDLYVSDISNNTIKKIAAVSGVIPASPVITTLGVSFSSPRGLAVDAAGNLYVSDYTAQTLTEVFAVNGVIPASPTQRVLATGFLLPNSLTIDAKGNLYVADSSGSRIAKVDVSDVPSLSFATTKEGSTSTDSPQTVTVANNGNAPLTFTPYSSLLTGITTNPFLGGTTPASYSLSNGGTCPQISSTTSTAQTLAAGASCTWMVSFTPTALSNAATLSIYDNNLNIPTATQVISLSGTGTGVPKGNSTLTGPSTQPVLVASGTAGSFPVTVSGSGSTPTGSVGYTIGSPCASACTGTATIASGVATVPTPSTLAPGAYTVAITYAGDTNYNAASGINVSIQVGKLTPTVTYPTQTAIAYGTALTSNLNATTAYSMTSLTSGGTTTYTATLQPSGSPVAVTTATVLGAGTYTLTATWTPNSGNSTTYNSASGTTTLVVNKASLTVTANNISILYGQALPVYTAAITGFVNGDTQSVVTGAPALSTTPATPTAVNTYTITSAIGTLAAANYTFGTFTPGTLTIGKSASAATVSQTAPLPANGGAGTGVTVTFATVVSDATSSSTGTPTGTVTFFNGTTAISTPVALVNGAATLTTAFNTVQTASITAQYSGDSNFTGSTSTAFAESIVAPGINVTANPTSLTVARGTPATATIIFTPFGNYQGTATYTCTGLPAFASCIFTPSAVTFAGNNAQQTSTLTLYTIAPYAQPGASKAAMLWIPAALLGMLLMIRRRKLAVATRSLLMLLVLACAAMGVVGCGSGQYWTPTGSDSVVVNVTATAAPGTVFSNTNPTATITITVQ